jgi:hypothetical protein
MQLDRRTGRRLPRRKAATEHLERHDENLRILGDDTFNRIRQRIGQAARGSTPRAPRGIAAFTGLVYCQCGCKAYRERSQNRKGDYFYYVCSRRTRYSDCAFGSSIREDQLTRFVRDNCARLFEHTEKIVARAIEIATEAVRSNRDDADRIKRDIMVIEEEQGRMIELLMDRAIADTAKVAISRKMSEAEAARTRLQSSLDDLRQESNLNTDEMSRIVRETFYEARANLAAVATPQELNAFIDRFIGPITISPDGTIRQKKLPATEVAGRTSEPAERQSHPTGCIAGACSVPHPATIKRYATRQYIRIGFWRHFTAMENAA